MNQRKLQPGQLPPGYKVPAGHVHIPEIAAPDMETMARFLAECGVTPDKVEEDDETRTTSYKYSDISAEKMEIMKLRWAWKMPGPLNVTVAELEKERLERAERQTSPPSQS
jgi:hypothetical protein